MHVTRDDDIVGEEARFLFATENKRVERGGQAVVKMDGAGWKACWPNDGPPASFPASRSTLDR